MKENHLFLSPDDPRLTAYALGELDPPDLAMVDAAVRNDAKLQMAVNEIRALAGDLTTALASEPVPAVTALDQRIAMPPWAEPGRNGHSAHAPNPETAKRSKLLRFPSLYYVLAGTAAAAFAVVVATRDPISPLKLGRKNVRLEVDFPALPPKGENPPDDSTQPTYEGPPGLAERRAAAKAEAYALIRDAFLRVMDRPRSTFSIDIGTTSYADVRRFLKEYRMPPPGAVRIEELVNYFPYQYEPPAVGPENQPSVAPIAAHLEVASAPWAPDHRLVRIGLKGRELSAGEQPSANGTSITVAKDVNLQIEFNPAQVAQYRLIGFENRLVKKEGLADDPGDAGEIGAGQSVTALYEIVPVGSGTPADGSASTPALKYAWTETEPPRERPEFFKEMLTLTLHYKEPAGDVSRTLEFPLVDQGTSFALASSDFQFAAAVASFGMLLRESPHRGMASMADVGRWAQQGSSKDPGGYRSEFLGLVRQAQTIRH